MRSGDRSTLARYPLESHLNLPVLRRQAFRDASSTLEGSALQRRDGTVWFSAVLVSLWFPCWLFFACSTSNAGSFLACQTRPYKNHKFPLKFLLLQLSLPSFFSPILNSADIHS